MNLDFAIAIDSMVTGPPKNYAFSWGLSIVAIKVMWSHSFNCLETLKTKSDNQPHRCVACKVPPQHPPPPYEGHACMTKHSQAWPSKFQKRHQLDSIMWFFRGCVIYLRYWAWAKAAGRPEWEFDKEGYATTRCGYQSVPLNMLVTCSGPAATAAWSYPETDGLPGTPRFSTFKNEY